MINIYFANFHISFTGFDEKQKRRLENCISENRHLLSTEFCKENTPVHINVLYIKSIYVGEKLRPQNERILCVGDFDDFESLLSCVRTGCYGCIASSNIIEEIVPAIIFALRNKIYISNAFASVIHKYFKSDNDKTRYATLFTNREHKLIQLLTTGALYKEIAWKMCISENTVRSHIRNIYSKLKVHSKTELTQKILKGNLVTSTLCFLSDYIACLCY